MNHTSQQYLSNVVIGAKPKWMRFIWRFLNKNASFLDTEKHIFIPLSFEHAHFNRKALLDTFNTFVSPTQFEHSFNLTLLAQHVSKANDYKPLLNNIKSNLPTLFLDGILRASVANDVLILADSGMGKTTLLQYVFYQYAKSFPGETLAFVYSGSHTREILENIPDNAIVFLDGLDEDALADTTVFSALERLKPELARFKKVVCSARIQGFANKQEVPQSVAKDREFREITLNAFSIPEAKKLLKAKFPDAFSQMEVVFDRSPDFFCRPLLLSWFDLLADSEKPFQYLFEVYDTIVQKWCTREASLEAPDAEHGYTFSEKIKEFAKKLALYLYEGKKDAIELAELNALANKLELPARTAQRRSFFTRNPNNDTWSFVHKAFFDYFLAQLLLEQKIEEEPFRLEDKKHQDVAALYNEMCWKKYAGRNTPPLVNGKPLSLGNDVLLKEHFPDVILPVCNLPNWAIRAMMTQLPKVPKEKISSTQFGAYWKDLIAIFRKKFPDVSSHEHYVFSDHAVFEAAIAGKAEIDSTQSYQLFFYGEYILQKYNAFLAYKAESDAQKFTDKFRDYNFELSFRENLPGCPPSVDIGGLLDYVLEYNKEARRQVQAQRMANFSGLDIQHTIFIRHLNPDIEALDLSNNQIEAFHMGNARFTELRQINLSNNCIATPETLLPILEFPELQELDLSGNKLPDDTPNSLPELRDKFLFPPNMVYVKGGIFERGSDKRELLFKIKDKDCYNDNEMPRHLVQLDDFFIGRYPVTMGEFRQFVTEKKYITTAEKDGPEKGSYLWNFEKDKSELRADVTWRHDAWGNEQTNDRHPVLHVSYDDAVAYCKWLQSKTGNPYRLPTEAEWEYAAKGGPETWAHHFIYAGSNSLDEVGWYYENASETRTKPTGKKKPNALGLYDMSGNVGEWCSDWYDAHYYDTCKNAEQPFYDPCCTNDISGDRVVRGGAWGLSAPPCRSAVRGGIAPLDRSVGLGFRLAFSFQ